MNVLKCSCSYCVKSSNPHPSRSSVSERPVLSPLFNVFFVYWSPEKGFYPVCRTNWSSGENFYGIKILNDEKLDGLSSWTWRKAAGRQSNCYQSTSKRQRAPRFLLRTQSLGVVKTKNPHWGLYGLWLKICTEIQIFCSLSLPCILDSMPRAESLHLFFLDVKKKITRIVQT